MQGGSFTQVIGNDGYTKTTAAYNTGKNENGWASSVLLSHWKGDGYVYGTQGEGWTYFAALGYAPEGSAHALNLSILGAGQWHHQRDSWVSFVTTNTSEKKELIVVGTQTMVLEKEKNLIFVVTFITNH